MTSLILITSVVCNDWFRWCPLEGAREQEEVRRVLSTGGAREEEGVLSIGGAREEEVFVHWRR